jgi:hypothetical protein
MVRCYLVGGNDAFLGILTAHASQGTSSDATQVLAVRFLPGVVLRISCVFVGGNDAFPGFPGWTLNILRRHFRIYIEL